MDRRITLLAAAVSLSFAMSDSALSAPFHPMQEPQVGTGMLQKVDGCHRAFRFHYVPEIGERAEHKHKGTRCVPVILEDGGGYDDDYDQCHEDGQRHSHPGYGRTTHSHYGRSCRVEVWDQYQGSGNCRNKLKVGPLTFCNN